jgi:hypothetical protein
MRINAKIKIDNPTPLDIMQNGYLNAHEGQ